MLLKAFDTSCSFGSHGKSTELLFRGHGFMQCPVIAGAEPRVYTHIPDPAKMLGVLKEYLSDCNAISKKPMQLVLFQFALEHVSRICRIITSPGVIGCCIRVPIHVLHEVPGVYSLVSCGETRVPWGGGQIVITLVTGTVFQDGCSGPHVTLHTKGCKASV